MAPRLPKTRFARSRMAASPPLEACDENPPTADSVRAVTQAYWSGSWTRTQAQRMAFNNGAPSDKEPSRWLFPGTIERMFLARSLPVDLGENVRTGTGLISHLHREIKVNSRLGRPSGRDELQMSNKWPTATNILSSPTSNNGLIDND